MDGNIINSFLMLLFVVAVIGVAMHLLKKTSKKSMLLDESLEMKILSKLALNQKNQLYIVQVGDKRLLLGVSENGVRSLSEISDDNKLEINKLSSDINLSNSKISDDNLSFKAFLKSTFKSQSN